MPELFFSFVEYFIYHLCLTSQTNCLCHISNAVAPSIGERSQNNDHMTAVSIAYSMKNLISYHNTLIKNKKSNLLQMNALENRKR